MCFKTSLEYYHLWFSSLGRVCGRSQMNVEQGKLGSEGWQLCYKVEWLEDGKVGVWCWAKVQDKHEAQLEGGSWVLRSVLEMSILSCCLVAKSCLTLRQPHELCSPPGSSVCGISQARILEWVAIFVSRASSWLKDWTLISRLCILHFKRILYHWATLPSGINLGFSYGTKLTRGLGRCSQQPYKKWSMILNPIFLSDFLMWVDA